MTKRNDKEIVALQEIRGHIKLLLGVDFQGLQLSNRVEAFMQSITISLDSHKYHIDEPKKPTVMDIMFDN